MSEEYVPKEYPKAITPEGGATRVVNNAEQEAIAHGVPADPENDPHNLADKTREELLEIGRHISAGFDEAWGTNHIRKCVEDKLTADEAVAAEAPVVEEAPPAE